MSVGVVNYSSVSQSSQKNSDRINKFETFSYEKYEKVSGRIGKAVSTSRAVLNTLANTTPLEGSRLSRSITSVTKKAKIFCVLGIPIGIGKMQDSLKQTSKSISIDDHEGTLENSLKLALTSADVAYAVSTATNTFLDIIGKKSIQRLADAIMPLCFFMSGIDIASRGMQLSRASKVYQEIDPAVFLKEETASMNDLRKRLQKTIGIRQEAKSLKKLSPEAQGSVEERKNVKLSRMIPKNVQDEVKSLFLELSAKGKDPLTPEQRKMVADRLQKIRFDLEKKMAVDALFMVASLVGVVALGFFCMNGMGSLPYMVQLTGTAIKSSADVFVEVLFGKYVAPLVEKNL